jgi:hypothetical protein
MRLKRQPQGFVQPRDIFSRRGVRICAHKINLAVPGLDGRHGVGPAPHKCFAAHRTMGRDTHTAGAEQQTPPDASAAAAVPNAYQMPD